MTEASMDAQPNSLVCGYPKEIVQSPLDKKYLCGRCHHILKEPMQSFCGHRFCKNCTNVLLANDDQVACPACAEEGAEGDFCVVKKGQLFPDNAMKREFLSWRVRCPNAGCGWEGTFKEYEVHDTQCEYRTVPCECGQLVLLSEINAHRERECPYRRVRCADCETEIPAAMLEEHQMTCEKATVLCDACGKEMKREALEQHYDKTSGECSAKRVSCPYGCGKWIDPLTLARHEEEYVVQHTRALQRRLDGLGPGAGGGEAMDLPSSSGAALGTPVQVSRDIASLHHKMSALERRVNTVLGGTSAQSMATHTSSVQPDAEGVASLDRKVAVLEEKVRAFENATAVLEQSIERSTSMIEALERSTNSDGKGLDARIKQAERSLNFKDLSISEIKQRIEALEVSSYDGVLLWKISGVARKREDAKGGRMTSIYSPPFYTSRTGYKMCARMYLNGDGMGKGTYISLFFVVMRNQYDALMRWPFRQKVTMILIDQNNKDHIIDAFRPDPSSSSFRKPSSEMNIASGCPLFCPLTSIDNDTLGYIRDDTMYIKIIVDTSDLNTA